LNIVAQGLDINPWDAIMVTEMDHHSNLVPWYKVAHEKNCRLLNVPVKDGELDMEVFEGMLRQHPKVVAFPAVSNVLGTVNPVAKLTRMAHEVGAYVVVDAAQAMASIPVDVHSMDVDFLAFSGHKMHGPTGVGVLYAKEKLIDTLKPSRFGGGMVANVTRESFIVKNGHHRLEAGTPPISQAIGLGEVCRYWNTEDMRGVHQTVKALTYEAYDRLSAMPGIHVVGPPRHKRIGIVSFTVEGIHAHDVASLLADGGIAVQGGHHCAIPLHRALGVNSTVRASFSYFNESEDIDELVKGLKDIQDNWRT
jgi:cysteine desulfurase/selenocysteine lyase